MKEPLEKKSHAGLTRFLLNHCITSTFLTITSSPLTIQVYRINSRANEVPFKRFNYESESVLLPAGHG